VPGCVELEEDGTVSNPGRQRPGLSWNIRGAACKRSLCRFCVSSEVFAAVCT